MPTGVARAQVREAEMDERAERLMQQLKLDGHTASSRCVPCRRAFLIPTALQPTTFSIPLTPIWPDVTSIGDVGSFFLGRLDGAYGDSVRARSKPRDIDEWLRCASQR